MITLIPILLLLSQKTTSTTSPPPEVSSTLTSPPTGATETNITTVTTSGTASVTAFFPPLEDVPECIISCLQLSVGLTNCTSIADPDCYCDRGQNATIFQNALVNCTVIECPEFDDLEQAESLAREFCEVSKDTLSFPTPTRTSGSSSTTSIQDTSPSLSGTPEPGVPIDSAQRELLQSGTIVAAGVMVLVASSILLV